MSTTLAIRDEQQYLATVSEVRALVERIEHVGDAKALADKARAAQVWAERARLGADQVNLAAKAKLWAERRAGELLIASRENGERDPGGRGRIESRPATQLADLGISKHESSRYQSLAEIPQDDFEQAIESAEEEGRVTVAAVEREHQRLTGLAKEEFFPPPTPAFDAFFKAATLLLQKALPDMARDEELDAKDRLRVKRHAEVMTERIAELADIATGNGLQLIEGGTRANH